MSQPESGGITPAPSEWVRLLGEAHAETKSLRMLWRRGRVPPRPLLIDGVTPEELDSERDWFEFENPETKFDYPIDRGELPTKRRERIGELVDKLWEIAVCWTRARDFSWCDFHLSAYDEDGELLFESGKRCSIPKDEESTATTTEGEHPSWRKIYTAHTKGLEDLIVRVVTDRDDAVRRAKQTLDDTHSMWSYANDAVRQAMAYQEEQLVHWKEHYSGGTALKARALAEAEKTERLDRLLNFFQLGLNTFVHTVAPLIDKGIEAHVRQTVPPLIKFHCAQQAMVLLVETLNDTQLEIIMEGDRQAASAFKAVLIAAAKIDDERESLQAIMGVLPFLRTQRYRDTADPDQQSAARFIMGQLALYRMMEYGETDSRA